MSTTSTSLRVTRLSRGVLPHSRNGRLVLIFGGTSLLASHRFGPASLPRGIRSVFVSTGGERRVSGLRSLLVRTTRVPSLSSGSIVIAGVHRCRTLARTLRSVRHIRRNLSTGLSKSFVSRSLERYVFRLSSVIKRIAASRMLKGVFREFYVKGWNDVAGRGRLSCLVDGTFVLDTFSFYLRAVWW